MSLPARTSRAHILSKFDVTLSLFRLTYLDIGAAFYQAITHNEFVMNEKHVYHVFILR